MKLFELQDRPVLDKVFPRNIMPQIRKNNLDDAGYEYEKKKIKLNKIKPVQDQRVQGMHDRAMRGFQDGSIRPIIIDKYNYIVNGHHRYDVARSLDMNKVKVIKVNATIEELIDRFSETASDEPTIEEQLKAKLQQKLNEIKLEPDLYKDSDPNDNSYITDTYEDASLHWAKMGRLPGIANSEIYNNGHTISIFIVENEQPIFLLNLKQLADGFSTVNVVSHSQHRGKGFAIPIYLAVSKKFGDPLYSFGSQSSAGNRIWEKLYQQYPNRIKAVNVKTNQELDVDEVLNDNNFETRIKLLPESVQEDVVGMNPHAVKPYFSPDEADRANNEWINQAQVDQEDGVIVKGTDGKQYRIMTSYGNQHFEDGEVYLDGVTDPEYLDKEGYPDAAELLYYHSATGHYPDDEEEIEESLHPDKMTGDEMRKLLDKKHAWDDGIHNPEFINDVRRHNWVLINNYPLAKLGSVEDPYNRIIDTDDDYAMRDSDLSEPIVIAPDRKSVMDGNHRVHKAREMGKTHLPAYFPMIEENLNTSTLTLDQMLSYLEKAMKEKHHQDWLGWVGQNKIFKLKTIPIDSVSPADGWRGDQNKIDNMAKSDLNNAPLIVVHKNGAIIDGNHRHQALKKQGAQTVKAYVGENFKDGKKKGKSRPGRVKRAGASCKGSVTSLRKKAKNSSGEKAKMYHWCANMKAGRKKK